MTNKKVLVTGATGYVGQHLVPFLVSKGYLVYILSRKHSSVFSDTKEVISIVGDITNPITFPNDIDTIYHCAGVIDDPSEMNRVNVLGTEHIVEFALKNNCRLIYLSSAGVIGHSLDMILTEQTPCHPHNAYEISKYKAEQIIEQAINHGLQAQILRPTTIFGPALKDRKDTFMQLASSMRNGSYKNIGNKSRPGIYNIVHIDEVVKAMELLDNDRLPNGNIYLINNTITYRAMDAIVKALSPIRSRNTSLTIPYAVAYIITATLTFIYFITDKKNPLTFSRLRVLTNQKIYSQQKLTVDLSFKNAMPIEQYIKNAVQKYTVSGLLS